MPPKRVKLNRKPTAGKEKSWAKKARESRRIWKRLKPAPASHPYLVKKGVGPGLCRVTKYGRLVVPVYDAVTGKLISLQYISDDGEDKKFIKGSRTKGACCVHGDPDGGSDPIVFCEGYATGASIAAATGWPVVVCFYRANLAPVAEAMRDQFPKRDLIVAADNDTKIPGNPGRTDATKAARLAEARLAVSPRHGDFNDLALTEGPDAVREVLDAAKRPPKQPRLSPSKPLNTARVFVARCFTSEGMRTLYFHRDEFYVWKQSYWSVIEPGEIRGLLYSFTDDAVVAGKTKSKPFNPNQSKVSQIVDALKAVSFLDQNHNAPCWLNTSNKHPPAESLIACRNGLLEIGTRTLWPHSPNLFNTNAVPFDFDPDAPLPKLWKRFLRDLWGNDKASIRALQEIFGLMLIHDTRHHKIFMLVGPKRSGKGTIGRVLTGLLGWENVAAPTIAAFGKNFGLSPLIDKRAAIISDARLGVRTDQTVVAERLLSVSGEDSITIDRKYRDPWTGRLNVRFLLLTNELPRIADASGALASRFVVLTLTKSFYGEEDTELTEKLLPELPGILNWSLRGLDRLQKRGHFRIPKSSRDAIQALEDLGSPVGAFLRDECTVGPGRRVETGDLFVAWISWCEEQGRSHPGNQQSFGRDLRAVLPGVRTRQHHGGERFFEGVALVE